MHSDAVVAALRGVPPEEYTNREDVARSLREDPDPDPDLDLSPAQRAEQHNRVWPVPEWVLRRP